MVLNNCTVCTVYGSEETEQKRIRVKYTGDQIFLYLKREGDLPDSEQVRIDFFDAQIGCIKTSACFRSEGITNLQSQSPGLQIVRYWM